jgi:hypothetical protein
MQCNGRGGVNALSIFALQGFSLLVAVAGSGDLDGPSRILTTVSRAPHLHLSYSVILQFLMCAASQAWPVLSCVKVYVCHLIRGSKICLVRLRQSVVNVTPVLALQMSVNPAAIPERLLPVIGFLG